MNEETKIKMLKILKDQVANFKVPDHGVEFYFDRKTMAWDNRETSNGEFKIITPNGIVVPIANFYKTFKTSESIKKEIEEFKETEEYGSEMFFKLELDAGLGPNISFGRVDGHRTCSVRCCNLFTGDWDGPFVNPHEQVRIIDMDHQSKRLAKLEYLFQRVREKSSLLDTFLRISEEVESEEIAISNDKTSSC